MRITSPEHLAGILSKIPDRKILNNRRQLNIIVKYMAALEALDRYEKLQVYDGTVVKGVYDYGAVFDAMNKEVMKMLKVMIKDGVNTRYSYGFRTVNGFKMMANKLGVPYVYNQRALKAKNKLKEKNTNKEEVKSEQQN